MIFWNFLHCIIVKAVVIQWKLMAERESMGVLFCHAVHLFLMFVWFSGINIFVSDWFTSRSSFRSRRVFDKEETSSAGTQPGGSSGPASSGGQPDPKGVPGWIVLHWRRTYKCLKSTNIRRSCKWLKLSIQLLDYRGHLSCIVGIKDCHYIVNSVIIQSLMITDIVCKFLTLRSS